MANGDNPLPQMQLDANGLPIGTSAPQQPAPAAAPPAPTPSQATPPAPASDTASSIAPTGFNQAQFGPGSVTVPEPYQGPALRGGPVKNILTRMFYGMGQAAAAHVGLPTDYDIQRTQFNQAIQANDLALKQAQQAYQQSTVTFQDPRTGMIYQGSPATMQRLLPAAVSGGYRTDVQTLANQGRFNVEAMKAMIAANAVASYKDSYDENGNPGVQMFNKFGEPMGFAQGAVAKSLMQTATTGQQHIIGQDGKVYVFQTYGTRTPVPPSGTAQPAPGGPPAAIPTPGTAPAAPGDLTPAPGSAPAPPTPLPSTVTRRFPQGSPAAQTIGGPGAGPTARVVTGPGGKPLTTMPGLGSVIGLDADGNRVLTSAGKAADLGLTDVQKADPNSVSSAVKARRWMTDLASIPNSDPRANPMGAGITQLINDLDRRGMLGPLAGRFNEFMAGTWGQGDPEYQALRTKLDLSNTLLASVHTGNRGGWNLIDNFKNLADQGKLSGAALKAAYGSEMDYVRRTQMLPAQGGGGGMPATPKVGDIVNGYKYNGGPPANPNSWVKQ